MSRSRYQPVPTPDRGTDAQGNARFVRKSDANAYMTERTRVEGGSWTVDRQRHGAEVFFVVFQQATRRCRTNTPRPSASRSAR